MPVTLWNPEDIAPPASRGGHAALNDGAARRLHLSAKIGLRLHRTLAEGLAAQIFQCLANIYAGLSSDGIGPADIVTLTWYPADGSAETIAIYRVRRDARFGAPPAPAATLLVAAALTSPSFLVEIDCIAAA